jgi:hypothetical protein
VKRYIIRIILLLLLLLGLSLSLILLIRPPQTNQKLELFHGVIYQREVRTIPRPLMVHVITIGLTAPGIKLLVTPGEETGGMELPARTTGEFLTKFELQLAINGSFFEPYRENGPWDYYPHRGDPVNVMGLAISNGGVYSLNETDQPVLCFSIDNYATISDTDCPVDTAQALAGRPILIDNGTSITSEDLSYYTALHPRTAVAIDQRGETLWLIVVDGRQPGYSEGVTLVELANIAKQLGAYQALNLDGGGSTTLVTTGYWWPRTLNSPIHTRIPMRQRPVANHLGIYALSPPGSSN